MIKILILINVMFLIYLPWEFYNAFESTESIMRSRLETLEDAGVIDRPKLDEFMSQREAERFFRHSHDVAEYSFNPHEMDSPQLPFAILIVLNISALIACHVRARKQNASANQALQSIAAPGAAQTER